MTIESIWTPSTRAARNGRQLKRETLVQVVAISHEFHSWLLTYPTITAFFPRPCHVRLPTRLTAGWVRSEVFQDAGRENAPIGYIPSFALWSGYHPSCDRERKGATTRCCQSMEYSLRMLTRDLTSKVSYAFRGRRLNWNEDKLIIINVDALREGYP